MGKLDDIIVIAATIHTREKEEEEFQHWSKFESMKSNGIGLKDTKAK